LACRKTAKAVKRRYRSRGALAHVVTISAYRRSLAIGAMRAAGVGDLGYGDPISWERARRAASPASPIGPHAAFARH